MLGTLVGGVLGFFAAALPSLFDAVKAYFEHRKDLDKTDQIIEAEKAGVTLSPEPQPGCPPPPAPVEVGFVPVYEPRGFQGDHLHENDLDAGEVAPFFIRVFATLRAGIRPLITYGFFILFVFVKLAGMYQGYDVDHTPAVQLLPLLWDESSQAMFAAVLSFWFGSRAIEKHQENEIAIAKANAGNNP